MLSVFIPSTPTPFTGFTITVPRSQAIDIGLTIDEALRFVLTGGVLVPTRQGVEPGDTIGQSEPRGGPGGISTPGALADGGTAPSLPSLAPPAPPG